MNIVILDGHILNPGDNPWTPIEALGAVTVYPRTAPQDIVSRCAEADIVLTNKTPLRAETLRRLPKLGFIGTLATGYDVVDVAEAAALGIPVCNVVAYGPDAVAEHVVALLLELCRDVGGHHQDVIRGAWATAEDWCFWRQPLRGLAGLTMGVMGFGNIGRKVGAIAHAFGMHVLACSRSPVTPPDYTPFATVSQEELFARSMVISLHCPLTDATRHFVNARLLATMRPGAILLNTARGALIDEKAVAEALLSGHLGGYGADVLGAEPPSADNVLCHAPRTRITPHIAWATLSARQNITRLTAENIAAWQNGTPQNVVNAPVAVRNR